MGGSHVVGRHLPSPSGPGSLPPGLITKRRMFDDGSSDISSAQSSMMDYSGEQLTQILGGRGLRSGWGTGTRLDNRVTIDCA